MRFNHKQPLIVLAIVGILFLPALLFYWFGFPFIAELSLVFMAAGILVTLSQFLSYYKIDYQKKKFLITHGWFYPEELESIPFEDITRLSIGFLNKEDKHTYRGKLPSAFQKVFIKRIGVSCYRIDTSRTIFER